MKKVFYLFCGLLIAVLTAGCAGVVPKRVNTSLVRNLAQNCKLDKSLRYYLTYNVETKEYSDKAILFLTYAEVADLMMNRVCLVERTIKDKPRKVKTPSSPKENENGVRDFTQRF